MQLNQGQEAAIQAVFQFLFSNEREFCVSGPAGTGKTTLMKRIMDTVIPEYITGCKILGIPPIDYEIHLTATTNKAAEVLAMVTGFPVSTIHSHMNLKVYDDYSTGVTKVTKTNYWCVHSKQVIFVDESSMVDSDLRNFILQGTDSTCKIIYIGDHCQMAPVFEKISPIYRDQTNFVELTEPVRNAEQPALMDLCNQLRNTVETLQFQPIKEVPGVIDYLTDSEAQDWVDNTFKAEVDDARILCYTNDRVQEYNLYTRLLRGYPELFTKGETLICNNAIQLGQSFLRVEQEIKVIDVLSAPYLTQIDPDDAGSEMEIYDLMIGTSNGKPFKVSLPTNQGHYKALMKYYAKHKLWKCYYQLKNTYPDLRQRDAATVYKAQGSTYNVVFLDLGNIGKCTQPDQVARMLYVGASRARTRVLLHGQLPAHFRGAA